MKNILTIGTIGTLAIMLFASLFGIETGFTLFMGQGVEHNIARVALIISLAVIMLTSRPRSSSVRSALAVVSVGVTVFALMLTADYSLQLFDTLAYFLAAVLTMVEALETEETVTFTTPQKV